MGRFLLLFLIGVVVALGMTNRINLVALDPRSVGTTIDGQNVLRHADEVDAHFTRSMRVDEIYMLFGGDAKQRRNQLTHATVAGLDIHDARSIAQRHPDFHRCRSRGAHEAKSLVRFMGVVASDRSTRSTLSEALELFEQRLLEGGERTCLRVRGSEIALDSVEVSDGGEDLSAQMLPAFAKTRFVLAEEASIEDCASLLR